VLTFVNIVVVIGVMMVVSLMLKRSSDGIMVVM